MKEMGEIGFGDRSKRRRSIRLSEYDYGQVGVYIVTVLTYRRKCVFGDVSDEEVHLREIGKVVDQAWREIPAHFPNVSNDEYVIMPNHLHGIVNIRFAGVGARHASPLRDVENVTGPRGTKSKSLGAIIGSFKSAASKRIHQINDFEHFRLWQRNYYEHVIRGARDYGRVLNYIRTNPMNWEQDSEYPFI